MLIFRMRERRSSIYAVLLCVVGFRQLSRLWNEDVVDTDPEHGGDTIGGIDGWDEHTALDVADRSLRDSREL